MSELSPAERAKEKLAARQKREQEEAATTAVAPTQSLSPAERARALVAAREERERQARAFVTKFLADNGGVATDGGLIACAQGAGVTPDAVRAVLPSIPDVVVNGDMVMTAAYVEAERAKEQARKAEQERAAAKARQEQERQAAAKARQEQERQAAAKPKPQTPPAPPKPQPKTQPAPAPAEDDGITPADFRNMQTDVAETKTVVMSLASELREKEQPITYAEEKLRGAPVPVIKTLRRLCVLLEVRGPSVARTLNRGGLSQLQMAHLDAAVKLGELIGAVRTFDRELILADPYVVFRDRSIFTRKVDEQHQRDAERAITPAPQRFQGRKWKKEAVEA